MKRRAFITLLGGAAAASLAAWPLAARAQQAERMRRVGVLMSTAEDEPEGQARIAAFRQALQQLGWSDGRNMRIDIRWSASNADRIRVGAAELVALAPDVILASGGTVVGALLQTTRTAALASEASGQRGDSKVRAPDTRAEPGSSARVIPIVFTQTPDPVGAGFVESLARPGGNATGFTQFEYGISAKWLELLKEIAPHVTRAAVLRDSSIPEGIGQFAVLQAAAPSLGVDLRPVDVRDDSEIERAVTAFARTANGGLLVASGGLPIAHRELITTLAARHRLPGVYSNRLFVSGGGLLSYGPDSIDPHRRAAGYVDRILKGEKPADLPVQAPVKYELAINLKTAKALGLDVPTTLLVRADEVIE
jgi:putative tryptophan/tyrosine transport system substrate-binding protein